MFLERSNFDSESIVTNSVSHEMQQFRPISYTETHASRTLLINNENFNNIKKTLNYERGMKQHFLDDLENVDLIRMEPHIHNFSSNIIHEAAKFMYGNNDHSKHVLINVEVSKNSFDQSREKVCELKNMRPMPVSYFLKCLICKRKVELQDSPVYTDRFIFNKQPLHAKEVILCQCDNSLYFGYHLEGKNPNAPLLCIQHNNYHRDFMPVYNICKTTSAGILYLFGLPQDTFDFRLLITNVDNDNSEANTHLYHRCINNIYTRSSNSGCRPMRFSLDSPKSIRTSRSKQLALSHPYQSRRSSLLLLEPLLMSSDSNNVNVVYNKNRFPRSKSINLMRILIVYILLFFISIIIMFYVLYFVID